jgi:biopolymer transport protein ExbB/TolQ
MLIWMALLVGAAAGISVLLLAPLAAAFQANPVFNGLILGVLAIGVLINFSQVVALGPAVRWTHETDRGVPTTQPPRLVAPLARVVAGRERERERQPFRMSTLTMRSLLDGVRIRLDESRDISRYMVSLLIFLGLLGTFWGLLDTIGGVSAVIGGLAAQGGDSARVFDTLAANLQGPLSGMGTAFSSSLFGLAGALALGVLDLQAGHAQNRFFGELEEWLAARTHLPGAQLGGEGESSLPHYIEALLERTAENLSQIQRLMQRSEEERRAAQAGVTALNDRLSELTDQLRAEQKLIVTLAKDQTELKPALAELAREVARTVAGNEEMRGHLRNADVALARLVDEVTGARAQMPEALHQEVQLMMQGLTRRPRSEV